MGQRMNPTAVEKRTPPISAEKAFGSAMPEWPSNENARIIPITVPTRPNAGESVRMAPTTMPMREVRRFFIRLLSCNYFLGAASTLVSPGIGFIQDVTNAKRFGPELISTLRRPNEPLPNRMKYSFEVWDVHRAASFEKAN
jgi:hypothetical protein